MTAASASKTKPKVLFVDDEVNILHGLKRQLHRSFEMDLADTVDQAFEFIEKSGPYMAVVSDMRMPDLSGTEFLKQVASAAPNTVRLMLTGNADQKTAVDAVNEAGVFRFLTKPCSKEEMTEALKCRRQTLPNQHRRATAVKENAGGLNGFDDIHFIHCQPRIVRPHR